jgi:hypothetical protein
MNYAAKMASYIMIYSGIQVVFSYCPNNMGGYNSDITVGKD